MTGQFDGLPQWMSRAWRAIEALDEKTGGGFSFGQLSPAEVKLAKNLMRHSFMDHGGGGV